MEVNYKITEKESKLLEIAKEVIGLNVGLGAKLTGSLMLAIGGLNKRREANDIDIICDYLCEDSDGFPIVPVGFKKIDMDGCRSAVDSISFINQDEIKLEFMYSEEEAIIINEISCGSIAGVIKAKQHYVQNDKNESSKAKHELDLAFLFANNDPSLLK